MAFPKKEGVVCESIIFNGRKYNRYPNATQSAHRRYYTLGGGNGLLHRDVWAFHNGPIPDGHDVHHKDGNWDNNDISNLECLPKSLHCKEHVQFSSEFHKRPEQLEHLAKIRDKAAEWHRSEEGRAWHKAVTGKALVKDGPAHQARKKALEERKKNPYRNICSECGIAFDALVKTRSLCSNTCACRRARRLKREKAGI
jgi:hypothetical protein